MPFGNAKGLTSGARNPLGLALPEAWRKDRGVPAVVASAAHAPCRSWSAR